MTEKISSEVASANIRPLIISSLLIVLGAFLYLDLGSLPLRAGILIAFTIVLWATGWLPSWLTALIFCSFCCATHLTTPQIALSGFTSSASWLVFSGIILGAAITKAGLGQRFAQLLAPFMGKSYAHAIGGSILFGLLMVFIMPSAMGRVVMMMPILVTLADSLGYHANRPGRLGIIFGGVFGTYLPASAVLTSNVPNNVLVGALETTIGHTPSYGSYFLLHFPVLGLVKIIVLFAVLLRLYSDRAPTQTPPQISTKFTFAERQLSGLLAATVLLWTTESLHGIPAAWSGMLAAIWCLMPNSGLLEKNPLQKLGLQPFFYVAGIVSMGALAFESGLASKMALWLFGWLPLDAENPFITFCLLAMLSLVMGLVVTLPGAPAVLTPLSQALSTATGWPIASVTMMQVVGFSTVVLPYQAPPMVVAIQLGDLSLREMSRVCLWTAVLSVLLLWPLDYLWWQLLGWIA